MIIPGQAIEQLSHDKSQIADPSSIRRVALVISELRGGGAERVIVNLAHGLDAAGLEPEVICLQQKGQLASELEGSGINVLSLESMRSYDLPSLYKLTRHLRRLRPSVMHVHDYSSLPYVVSANMMSGRRPLVFSAHGLLYQGFEQVRRRYRFFSRGIDVLAAVSPQVRARHCNYLNWKGRTELVPNGAPDINRDPGRRIALREEFGVRPQDRVFLAVGNARPEKGFEDLVSAAANLRDRSSKHAARIWVAGRVGEDDYGRRLQQSIVDAGIPGFELLGYREDTRDLYSAADALVISSRSEGLPMVLLEAMTAGLPVIATRVGGIPDALPANCGRLVPPQRPEELTSAMQWLLDSNQEQLDELGEAARRHAVEEFSVNRMTQRYLSLYAAVSHDQR